MDECVIEILYSEMLEIRISMVSILCDNVFVFSSYRGETRSLEYASTEVVNSRYD